LSITPTTAPVTAAEAKNALKDIEQTENRAAASRHGRFAAPHLIVWGVAWAIGYTANDLAPQYPWVWTVVVLGGIAGSFLFDRKEAAGRVKGFGWRYLVSFATVFVFIYALFVIMQPHDYNQVGAFFPLVIGLYYTFIGVWTKGGWRMLPLGLALMALTLGGYYFLPEHFLLWMAAVGGGGLILGGLWLRSV
jgi:hypothetical protein